jgi:hypothetical protein
VGGEVLSADVRGGGGGIKRGSTESSKCDEENKFAKGVIGGKFTSKGKGNAECEKKINKKFW